MHLFVSTNYSPLPPVTVTVHKVDNLGVGLGTGDTGLWQEYAGWQLEKVCGAAREGGAAPDLKVREEDVIFFFFCLLRKHNIVHVLSSGYWLK